MNQILKIILHGIILALVNIISVMLGFGIYCFYPQSNKLILQIPIYFLFSAIVFITFAVIIKYKNIKRLAINDILSIIFVYIISLLLTPLLFLIIHFVSGGFVTSNIDVVWSFAALLPINFVILSISYLIFSKSNVPKPQKNYFKE